MSLDTATTKAVFRAEVVGSLLRPEYLKHAREAVSEGRISAAAFKEVEDRAVDEAIAAQEGAGFEVVTDGEFRRQSFMETFMVGVEGVTEVDLDTPGMPKSTFHTESGSVELGFFAVVTDRLRVKNTVTTEEFAYSRGRAHRTVKVTVPSPMLCYLMWSPQMSRHVYPDPFELFADAAVVIRAEIEQLAKMGCTYIQIDAPEIAHMCDPTIRSEWADLGMPPERVLSEGIDLLNSVVDGIRGPRFAIHLCRGNAMSAWIASGGYDAISEKVFPRATAFDTFLLEYDDDRSGGFEPLRNMPDDKIAVLGLVTTKKGELEPSELLKGRITKAARHFPLEQLALSTQCGFASEAGGNALTREDQAAKLRRITEVAEEVWG